MNETFDQVQLTQILYEIAISIGSSIELRPMLKTSLATILKKLNCVSGGVYQRETNYDGTYRLDAVYVIPRRPQRNATYQEALDHLPVSGTVSQYQDFLADLPFVGQSQEENFYHILELPNFGLLLLVKNREPLSDPLIKSLSQLVNKLAAAAVSCVSESKLRQSEERYRMLTGATFDGIVIHDSPIIREINPALANILNYELEELVGGNIFDYLAPECHELARVHAETLVETPYELIAIRKDGIRLPIEVTDREYTEDGHTYRVTAVRDLTHQKQLETELKSIVAQRTRQVEVSTQIAQDIAQATTLEDLYKQIVTEVKELFGYYHAQLLRYDPDIDAVKLIAGYGDVGAKMQASGHQMPMGKGLIGTAAATGNSVLRSDLSDDPDWRPNPLLPDTKGEIAIPIKLRDEILGVLDVQSDQSDALTNSDQLLLEGLCGQIAVAIDTTRLTSNLQETTNFLDSIIDNIPNMIFVKEAEELRFVRMNKTGQDYLGIGLDELLGKNDYDFFAEEDADLFIAKDRETLTQGQLIEIPEETLETVFGPRILHTRKVPIMGYDNKPKYLLGISDDITDRKKTEDALRESEHTVQVFLEKQKILHELGLYLSTIEDPKELYREAIKRGHTDLGFDRIGLYLLDDKQEFLHGTYGYSPKGVLKEEYDQIHILAEAPWMHQYIYDKERLSINENSDLHEDGIVVGQGWNITSALWTRNHPVGLLFADNLVTQQPLQPHQPELLAAYGATIANLISRNQAESERIVLLKETEQQAKDLAQLNELSTELNQAQTVSEIYQLAGKYTAQIVGGARASLALVSDDNNTFEVFGLSGLEGAIPLGMKLPIKGTAVGITIRESRLTHFPKEAPMEAHPDTNKLAAGGILCTMSAPLIINGEVIGSINVGTNTTSEYSEQKQTLMMQVANLIASAMQVKEEQERTQTILQSVTIPMIITRLKDGHVFYINEQLAQQVGAPVDELIGNQAPNFYANPEDRTEYIERLNETGVIENYELLLKRSDGSLYWGMLSAKTIQFQGEPALISTVMDISESKAAQASIVKQAEELQTVADLSTKITSIQDQQELLETIVQETQKRFNLYHCHIFLIDESGKNLSIRACGWHPDSPEYGTHGDTIIPMNAKQSLVAQAAQTQKPVVINNVMNDPNWLPNKLLPDTLSELAVPMLVGDRIIGVLDVQSTQVDRFGTEDIKIQLTLAAQIAVGLENAQSLERSSAAVAELDALTRRLTRESWEGYLSDFEEADTGFVYNLGKLSSVRDEDLREMGAETAVSTTNGHLSQSLMVHGEAIGHLTIFDEQKSGQSDSDAALIMAAVAEQLSARVENIRLTDQTQQALAQTQVQAQRLGLLNEISAEMSNVETLNQVFDIIFARIPNLLKADRISLSMLQPDRETLKVIGYQGEDVNVPTGAVLPLANSPMGEALQKGQIVVNNNATEQEGIRSSMVAPLFSAGRAIGTLNVGNKKPNAMTEQDETLLQQLATMLSSVIENKQLLAAAQARAERERQVRTITDKIRRGTDRDAILDIAQKEISKLIGAKQSVAQLGTKTQLLDRIQQTIERTQVGEE